MRLTEDAARRICLAGAVVLALTAVCMTAGAVWVWMRWGPYVKFTSIGGQSSIVVGWEPRDLIRALDLPPARYLSDDYRALDLPPGRYMTDNVRYLEIAPPEAGTGPQKPGASEDTRVPGRIADGLR
jgi:hypothetical protein